MGVAWVLFQFCLLVALLIGLARALFPVPVLPGRTESRALPPVTGGPIVAALCPPASVAPGLTGIRPMPNGADAFAARLMLADAAVSSIDVQYYIWYGDLTGFLLLDALKRAAERGVRVRLLLDDNGTAGLDRELAALDAHPNAEVRLYNPFNLRRVKPLCYGFDFFRLNRRMHNKSFTVDGVATILGGRNIGDRYFETCPEALFIDLDVLAAGAIVPEVSADFDRYWACRSAHPASDILRRPKQADPIAAGLSRFCALPAWTEFRALVEASPISAALRGGDLALQWTKAVLVSDDPIKGQGAVPRQDLLATRLRQAVGQIEHRLDVVSPYLVPGKAGVRAFATLTAQGIAVRALTNAIDATDVVAVHAGYAKRRRAMLRAGMTLFEVHARAEAHPQRRRRGRFRRAKASLHAKTFAVDGKRVFVGSFNFDPRSTTLNTEMGILIDSPQMAEALHTTFDSGLAGLAWKVALKGRRKIWIDMASGVIRTKEPGLTAPRRLVVAVVGWLPVEWLM
ncbi:phospholipase D family protein [Pseudotabrizicola algicola]|uniref:Phospholipase D n=1 Tax=Pseudotabrizicola algicola TaxID=2709381 RepID=A0A6B3RP85_9RHOB|nr:phospholipase D family protein [Pseudotabrizicola algicola]NEX47291.1 phospholipase D family protein [Pseudotabrizicola algicola]